MYSDAIDSSLTMDWLDRPTLRSIGVGFGLMLLGIVFGVVGVNVTLYLAVFVGAAETEYGHWITRYGLQYGFLMLAVAYIFYRGIEIGVLNTEVGFTGLY